MALRLRYHTRVEDIVVHDCAPQVSGFKPIGLWYSVGEEWKDWCKTERFGPDYTVVYTLEVDESKILRLTTPKEILAFTSDYRDSLEEVWTTTTLHINWAAVERQWSGIEIAPYQWSLRLQPMTNWYCAWDVASGCLWSFDALISAQILERRGNDVQD